MNKNKKVRCSHSSLGGGFCSPAACVVWRCPPPSGAPGAPSQKQREVPLPRFSDIVWCHDLSYTAPLRKTVNITKLLLRNPGFPTGRSPASVDRPVDTDANGEGRWRGFEICVASGPEAWPPRDQAPRGLHLSVTGSCRLRFERGAHVVLLPALGGPGSTQWWGPR